MRTIEELKAEVAATQLPQETKGEARGRAEGEAKRNIEIAKLLKEMGFSLTEIAKTTELSIDTINTI